MFGKVENFATHILTAYLARVIYLIIKKFAKGISAFLTSFFCFLPPASSENLYMRKKIIRYGFLSLCLLFSLPSVTQAQENLLSEDKPLSGWYLGLQGGTPFGVSTFNSFGADKTRLGLSAGIYGGYRFNPVLSLEAQAAWGNMGMSAQDSHCAAYWLGADGNRYLAPVLGAEGWNYGDLYNKVSLQRYSLQLNVDVLQLFSRNTARRWTIEVSPLLAAVNTKVNIKTIKGDNEVMQGSNNWHLGAGGNLAVGYRITENLSLGLYSGVTWLTGDQMDGMPKHIHKENYIWESGVRLGWTFGKKKRSAPRFVGLKDERIELVRPHTPGIPVEEDIVEPVITEPTVTIEVAKPIEEQETTPIAKQITVDFPTIYFTFNSITVASNQKESLQEILAILKGEPELKITLTGWCDSRGSVAVNDRISKQRAEAVKVWLINNGIAADRIVTAGGGIDHNAADADKARRVETRKEDKR